MENFAKFFSEQQKLSFEFHDELNSKFWKNEKMLPQVRRHLLMIAEKWAKFSKIPPKAVEDVVLTGGNANYNYTSQSDLDLHLILDFSKVKECKDQSDDFINEYLKEKKTVWEMTHNITIYGVSVELYGEPTQRDLGLKPLILATKIDRDSRRLKISNRLKQRLNEGMVAEVEELLNKGILPEDLKFYGLEYLWITRYCLGEIDYQTMVRSLETAIHQFAKRQMTWFRRMEKQGYELNWMDATIALKDIDELMR